MSPEAADWLPHMKNLLTDDLTLWLSKCMWPFMILYAMFNVCSGEGAKTPRLRSVTDPRCGWKKPRSTVGDVKQITDLSHVSKSHALSTCPSTLPAPCETSPWQTRVIIQPQEVHVGQMKVEWSIWPNGWWFLWGLQDWTWRHGDMETQRHDNRLK